MFAGNIGDIIVVQFPFVQTAGYKKRPAVVLKKSYGYWICAAITSNQKIRRGSVNIKDWAIAGLELPSCVMVSILTTFFFRGSPVEKIGSLTSKDLEMVFREFNHFWPKSKYRKLKRGGTYGRTTGIAV